MHPLLLTAWIACQSLDLGTTVVGLRNPNIREGNPVMRGPQLATLKVSVNVLAVWGTFQLAKKAPKAKATSVIPIAAAVSGCLAGSLNIRTIRSVR